MTRVNGEPFSWAIESRDSMVTLRLSGELDLAIVEASKDTLVDDVIRTQGSVVVDFSELEFIDSTGLRLLLDLKFKLDERGRTFALGATSPAVARVLDVSGIRSVLEKPDGSKAVRR